jgi:hypothetical protein
MPYTATAGLDIGNAAPSLPITLSLTNLSAGENLLAGGGAPEKHQQHGHYLRLALDSTSEVDTSGLRLNEAMALNRRTAAEWR